MQQPLLYTYGTLSLNTYGKLMFSPGVSYYHNVIVMGLVKLYLADVITLDWIKEEHEVASFDARVKRKQEMIELVTFSKKNPLPDTLQEYAFLYQMIPDGQSISILDFVAKDYENQRNLPVSDMQKWILDGMLKGQMILPYVKKGLFGKKKELYKANHDFLESVKDYLRTVLTGEHELNMDDFMLCYLVQTERMLAKLYDKQEAKELNAIASRKITVKQQEDNLFLKLTRLIWFLEESVFVNL